MDLSCHTLRDCSGIAALCIVALAIVLSSLVQAADPVVLDNRTGTDSDERQKHAAWIGFRPADGQVVDVNPPRFSWPYHSQHVVPGDYAESHTFTLQIAGNVGMSNPVVEVETPYNFYNALPVLGGYDVYWRVGYDVGTEDEQWSRVRVFRIDPATPEWDRTIIKSLDGHLQGHPRIGFTPENIEQLRALKDTDEQCGLMYERLIERAERIMQEEWFNDMPEEDPLGGELNVVDYRDMATDMRTVAMAFMLTGDEKYLAVIEPLMVMASYPPGGESSPEGLGPRRKWATRCTQDLGLMYDWLYDRLDPDQRRQLAHSLEWRTEHILNNFSWKRSGTPFVRGLSMFTGSHQYEDYLWTLVGALAIADVSEVAAEFCEMGLNYLTGVTNPFGTYESWNEGVLYGNAKCHTLMDATCWTAVTLPELHIERNPYYGRIGDFFAYLSPVGIEPQAWGNYGRVAGAHLGGHVSNFRRLAFLTGKGNLLKNWQACSEKIGRDMGKWQEYLLEHYYDLPEPSLEPQSSRLFNVSGWAMGLSGPPSDPATFEDGVGMIFHCRPQGGHSHSFNSENAFEIFAHGDVIATGGGRKANGDRHAAATMSHNSVLIDGLGQNFDQMDPETETAGRIVAWENRPGLTYWCGDATGAYASTVPYLKRFLRHVLFIDEEVFVIFDDLAVDTDHDPATFSWLYHVHQDIPIEIDEQAGSFSYETENASVTVQHLADVDGLEFTNMRGEDGYKNIVTGEDMLERARDSVESSPLRKFHGPPVWNNIWVNNEEPTHEQQFLAAVMPAEKGQQGPSIEASGDGAVTVNTSQGTTTIAFGSPGEAYADIVLDYEEIRHLAGWPAPPANWETTWEADVSATDGWVLDGEAQITHDGGVLDVKAETAMVLWPDYGVREPVMIDFEAKTEDAKARCILFFMAEGLNGEDIFGWERQGEYGDYAYEETMELYSVGMMREGAGTGSNLREMG
ncbi:MAG: DUF4962 domain-containing protein, partial [Armatimonadota bacterium]